MSGMGEDRQSARVLPRWVLRHRVAVAAALVVMAGLAGPGIAVASRYQPIELSVGPTPPVVLDSNGTPAAGLVKDVPGFTSADPATPTVTSTEPNTTVSVSYMISSHGKFAVQVLDVDTPFGARAAKLRVFMGDADGSPAKRPFRKFTLRRGDLRLLTIEMRPKICPGADGRSGVAVAEAQDVTYRSFGMTHRTRVAFHGTGYGITGVVSC
jgi:hypothetical protein